MCAWISPAFAHVSSNPCKLTVQLDSLHQRTVRIYQPSKPATQSGKAGTRDWRLDFDILQGSGRWESPLMGWASTYVYDTAGRINDDRSTVRIISRRL